MTFKVRPLVKAFFASSGMGIAGRLPAAETFSTKSSPERTQMRKLTMLGRDPLTRSTARQRVRIARRLHITIRWARLATWVSASFVVLAFEVGNAGTGHDEDRHQHADNDDGGASRVVLMCSLSVCIQRR
jgi:hypothetical protein